MGRTHTQRDAKRHDIFAREAAAKVTITRWRVPGGHVLLTTLMPYKRPFAPSGSVKSSFADWDRPLLIFGKVFLQRHNTLVSKFLATEEKQTGHAHIHTEFYWLYCDTHARMHARTCFLFNRPIFLELLQVRLLGFSLHFLFPCTTALAHLQRSAVDMLLSLWSWSSHLLWGWLKQHYSLNQKTDLWVLMLILTFTIITVAGLDGGFTEKSTVSC